MFLPPLMRKIVFKVGYLLRYRCSFCVVETNKSLPPFVIFCSIFYCLSYTLQKKCN
jgi:hypothetical protein